MIADVMLGDGNGPDRLHELARRPALDAHRLRRGHRSRHARLDALGVTEVLAKPVSLAALHGAGTRAREATRPEHAPAIGTKQAATGPAPAPPDAEAAATEGFFGGERSLHVSTGNSVWPVRRRPSPW